MGQAGRSLPRLCRGEHAVISDAEICARSRTDVRAADGRRHAGAGAQAGRMMDRQDEAVQSFEPHRRRLTGLAYRMLGSLSEAEDIVQEAYLRWHTAERARVDNPQAYLSRTVARLCLDHLKSARARRETYVGPWLPEPIVDQSALSPDSASELADDLSVALLMT